MAKKSKERKEQNVSEQKQTVQQRLVNYCRAGYGGLYVTSYEEKRVESELASVAKEIGWDLWVWTCADGLCGPVGYDDARQIKDIDEVTLLKQMRDMKGNNGTNESRKVIVLAKDFHLYLGDRNPEMIRAVKDALQFGREHQQAFVVLGCQFQLPPELEKEFTPIEFTLPTKEQLGEIAQDLAKSVGIDLNGEREKIEDAAAGMTTTEAVDAISLAIVESNKTAIDPKAVQREKCNIIRKTGLLEIVEQNVTLDEIGGLENLKAELDEKRSLFTKAAREYGLATPRGILTVGNPGTGKSLTATATKTIFNVPLVRLEAGKLFGTLVGESEANWRTAFATVKAIAPVCFWIDEVDGLVSGMESSGRTDGGTTARVVKAILQDMQFNSEGIFYCFTANDIDGLPDPLIDRLDVWAVDLPNEIERQAIWAIHISKCRAGQTRSARKPDAYDVARLSQITDGFSGRQIEQVWLKAMNLAFNDGEREPVMGDVVTAASKFVATSKTMAVQIEARRRRLEGKATPASAPMPISQKTGVRQIA